MFSKAIVRAPSENFADGLTSVDLGVPVFETAVVQHRAYCEGVGAVRGERASHAAIALATREAKRNV